MQKQEKRILELMNLLAKDSDKITHAKEIEHIENVVKILTNSLKQQKQDSHLKELELQKKEQQLEETEFIAKKLKKDNEFLMQKIEQMELESHSLIQKEPEDFKDKDFDLDEQFGEAQSQQRQIEDLHEELRLLKQNNTMLLNSQSYDKQEILQQIEQLTEQLEDKERALQKSQEKQAMTERQLNTLKNEYD
jgi:DNA repair exonuclease SbcCD ATPase subunit